MDPKFLLEVLSFTHKTLFRRLKGVSADHFGRSDTLTSPPIAWHVWHLARFTDIFLATFPGRVQVWTTDQMAESWGFEVEELGAMQAGMDMRYEVAQRFAEVGQEPIMAYAKATFRPLEDEILALNGDFSQERPGLRAFRIVDGRPVDAEPPISTVYADILFHYGHVNRHIGMMEGLLGIYQTDGTASV